MVIWKVSFHIHGEQNGTSIDQKFLTRESNISLVVLIMLQSYKLFLSVGIYIFLSACDISTPDPGNGMTTSTIIAFTIEGNIDGDNRVVLPLNTNNSQVSGAFDLSWDVVSSDPYWLNVYVSNDIALDDTDVPFYEAQCGTSTEFTCEHSDAIPCAIHYDPSYNLIDGERETNPDGSFVVLADHYYLRCSLGGLGEDYLEITDRIVSAGFPASPYSPFFILQVCAEDEINCPEFPIAVQFLSSLP